MRRAAVVSILVAFALVGGALRVAPGFAPGGALAQGQPSSSTSALQRLFSTDTVQSDWFAPSFLQQVPLPQAQAALGSIRATLGTFQSVQTPADGFLIVFDRGSLPVQATIDSQGRFAALALGAPHFNDPELGLRSGVSGILSLPGSTSLLIQQNGQDLVASNTDKSLGVGSAFELAVLAALRTQIDANTYTWDRVVALAPDWKTLPSGVLQNWPDASPLTLSTLASLMISASDNTAADGLITILGRPVIEAVAPANSPFPTPHEVYVLKDPANADLLGRWRGGDAPARSQVLAEADQRSDPSLAIFASSTVLAPDVEWFFSARDLCGIMGKVQDLPLMGIDPGLANREDWAWIAYKGGFEPGAINSTLWLRDKTGRSFCVTATWNGTQPVDQSRFNDFVRQIVSSLANASPTTFTGPITITPAAPAPSASPAASGASPAAPGTPPSPPVTPTPAPTPPR